MSVLITGASGGLGRAFAAECAARGFDLYLTDINENGLAEIKQGLQRQYDVQVITRACDLTDKEQVKSMFAEIEKQSIGLDMLLGVAGLDFEGGFEKRDCEHIIDIVNINIAATLRVTHAALRQRDKAKKFSVVIVSSLASQYPIPLKATYAASKRFLLDFSIALRQELKSENVNVLALCPGGLPTTNEALSGIAAQGFWGRATTVSLPSVAHKTITRVLKGRSVYIPGIVNRMLTAAGKLLPKTLIAKMLLDRWNAAQAKWLDVQG
jgi:short-subunit dehydrogenase